MASRKRETPEAPALRRWDDGFVHQRLLGLAVAIVFAAGAISLLGIARAVAGS